MSNPCDGGVGAVVLAAGGSRRLGRAKQLVPHKGRTLLENATNAALSSGANPVVVVLGASAGDVARAIPSNNGSIRVVTNAGWKRGMGSSIACGVRALLDDHPNVSAAMILVCDQPRLDAILLRKFVAKSRDSANAILVSDYGSGRGPPVLFPRRYFDELLALDDDTGAREVHRRHPDVVELIPFPDGAFDIDTPADLDASSE